MGLAQGAFDGSQKIKHVTRTVSVLSTIDTRMSCCLFVSGNDLSLTCLKQVNIERIGQIAVGKCSSSLVVVVDKVGLFSSTGVWGKKMGRGKNVEGNLREDLGAAIVNCVRRNFNGRRSCRVR